MTKASPLQVIKRDGKKENFEPFKIVRIAQAAGLTDEEVDKMHSATISRVKEIAQKNSGEILSTKIRDIVIEELKEVNEYAAGLYEWYEKTKNTK